MPHMHLFYKVFEGLNEIMYVNSLCFHCPAHGRCFLKNVFSLLYVLCISCWVKQKFFGLAEFVLSGFWPSDDCLSA